jgi:hypothetical protein
MDQSRRRLGWAPAIVFLALLVGCGGSGSAGDSGSSAEPSSSTEQTSEPPAEPTGPETTQPTQDRPTIRIVSAPIGGNVSADSATRCAEVNWLGNSPIPAGTTIALDAIRLDPGGVFELDQTGCTADLRPCTGVRWQSDNVSACHVGVRQIANAEDSVRLLISATATCRRQSDCESLVEGAGGSQISFTPSPEEPSPSPEEPSPSPEEPSPSPDAPTS